MAEIGLAASIIAVIQISEDVISRAYNYGKAVKAAKKDMAKIQGEIENLQKTLTKLKDLAQMAETSGQPLTGWPTLVLLQSKESPLHGCQSALESLQPNLDTTKFFGKFKWPRVQKKVNATLQIMICQKNLLVEALNIDQASQVLSTGHAVDNIAEAQVEQQKVSLSTKSKVIELKDDNVIRWLICTDASVNKVAAFDKHEKNTGKWLLEDPRYISWSAATHGFLWIHGPSGCGKTVLCSIIIEHTLKLLTSLTCTPLAYYYFDITDREKQTVTNLLRSLIGQICDKIQRIPDVVSTLHKQYYPGIPPRQALIDTITSILSDVDHVYIYMDALDECSELRELFALLKHLHKHGPGKIHLLVTSQDQQYIEESLDSLTTETINVQGSLHDLDIQLYVRESLKQGGKLEDWADHLVKLEIETRLRDGAYGSFRWVSCQIDSLCKCLSEDDIMEALEDLPADLEETYSRILRKIASEGPTVARKIHTVLQWLAFSRRHLSLAEAAEASAMDPSGQFTTSSRLHRPDRISDICSSLVVVASDREEFETIRFAHPSVQRYLVSQPPDSDFALSKADAHTLIAESCLRYLLQFGMEFGRSESRSDLDRNRQTFPLCSYAVQYWPEHYALIPGEAWGTNVERLAIELLDDNCQCHTKFIEFRGVFDNHPLYHASRFGLTGLVKKLLAGGANSNQNNNGPLQQAAKNGHLEIVKLLLDHGAEINHAGGYRTPLALAAEGHVDIVQLLLDMGADVNAVDSSGRTALHRAAENSHAKPVQLLVEQGADINLGDGWGQTDLHPASARSLDKTVLQLLLENAADVNTVDEWGDAALYFAALYNDSKAVQLLLENGADVNAVNRDGQNALHSAAAKGSAENVQLLVDKVADVNAVDRKGRTALHFAAINGDSKTIQLLLDNGVDINAVDKEGSNALRSAAAKGFAENVQLLVEKVADVNAVDRKGLTALHFAAVNGDTKTIQLLLDNGADVNAIDKMGRTALHWAAADCDTKTLQQLLDKGADINAEDKWGATALDIAAKRKRDDISQLLSDRGASGERFRDE